MFIGNPGVGVHQKTVHWGTRLPHHRRYSQELLREVGKDCGRRGDERSKDQAFPRFWIHNLL